MPKKKFGTNSKSEAARARKEDKKQTEKARQKAQKEAAMWQDDDKAVRRQREREEQRRRKQQQTAEKKALNRQLAQEDEKKTAQSLKPKKIETCKVNLPLKGNSGRKPGNKATRFILFSSQIGYKSRDRITQSQGTRNQRTTTSRRRKSEETDCHSRFPA
eukprot:m.134193 g.134193  ORF g.134193 m.134193 type:complete len:160 (-) comp23858_c0_seq1:452-931(-)